MTASLLLLAHVAAFAVWPFLIVRTTRATGLAFFHVTNAVSLVIAAVLGSLYALPVAGLQISLGNIAYAAVIVTTAAMFAATRDLRTLRDTAAIVVVVNAVSLMLLSFSTSELAQGLLTIDERLPSAVFVASIPVTIVGGLLHLVELAVMVVVMERAHRLLATHGSAITATIAALVLVLVFDGVAFPTLVTLVVPDLAAILSVGWQGVAAKALLGSLFAGPLALFLARHRDELAPTIGADDEPDLRRLLFGPRRELVTTMQDAITSREQLRARLEETVENITDGIVTFDDELRVRYINGPAAAELGSTPEELLGTEVGEILDQPLADDLRHLLRQVPRTGEWATLTTDQVVAERWFQLRIFPGEFGATVYASDITDRVEHEQQLTEVALAEQRAADRLREVDRIKNAFLTAVSHELRTPLTVVHGLAETLERVPDGRLPASERRELEHALLRNTGRLQRLLEDLLDLDRLLRGVATVRQHATDVGALLLASVEQHPAAEHIRVEPGAGCTADVDPTRIERIVENLLDNAVKYGEPPIVARVTCDDLHLTLSVSDQGQGIPAEERDSVFDAFHRLHQADPQPGTGIGLALVREFAELHGGHARVTDDAPGATIEVVLPRRSASPVPGDGPTATGPSGP